MNIELREVTEDDYDFTFEAKKQAMELHISSKWGWDEKLQLSIHKQRWVEKPWFVVLFDKEPIGTVSIDYTESEVRFGEFYLLNEFQNQGIGTKVLFKFLSQCDREYKRVVLEYLKWNPVGSLYKRHGFEVTGENENHYFMVREPNSH